MKSRTDSLDSLLLRGFFDIPSYQRAYSWEESQLQDLLDDLRYLPDKTQHFFGNIIVDEKGEQYRTDRGRRFDSYEVVDGQQRLTTAIILLFAATELDETIKETTSEDNLLFPIDERPRLLPQDQDKEFFRDSLLGGAKVEAETPSQERLDEAYEFYKRQLSNLGSDTSVQDLAETLRYDLIVNVVELEGESEAASIFESLNDRGKDLSSLDKTKSFLMYMDDRTSNTGALEEKINERFGGIFRDLFVFSNGHGSISDFDEGSFQRYHWGIYDGYDSDEYYQGLATLKSRLRSLYRREEYGVVQDQIDEYTQSLREASSAFASLFRPSQRPKQVREPLVRLLELGRLANVLPVLIAAQLEWGDSDPGKMATIVDTCETLAFRVYAIDRRRADTGRGKLVSLAHKIRNSSDYGYPDTVSRLEKIIRDYAPDERFKRDLRDPGFYDTIPSQDVRYLLFHYSQNLDANMDEETSDLPTILSKRFQVEHILARNLGDSHVPQDLQEEFEENVDRLGNLTIASESWNKSYGDLPFKEKKKSGSQRKKSYASSTLRAQKVLVDIDDFGKADIEEREEEIIQFALKEWSLSEEGSDSEGRQLSLE